MLRNSLFYICLSLLALVVWVSPLPARCLEGTIVGQLQTEGQYRGLYKYTVTLSFALEKGLSNVTLDLQFDDCPELACGQVFLFEDPAGTQEEETTGCPIPYLGEFSCKGNPSIDLVGPVVKWDATSAYGCEPGTSGAVTLSFYANLAPDPTKQVSVFLIKNGQGVCEGIITGAPPSSPCAVPTHEVRWGGIKSIYQ